MVAMNVVRETIVAPAPTTPSARPMATAPVKAMHRAANGPTARPVTTVVCAMTVLRVMIAAPNVLAKPATSARVSAATTDATSALTVAMTSAARLTAAPRVATMNARRNAHRPHGARTVAPTAATSVAMTAAPWAMTTGPAARMHAPAPDLTCARTHARTRARLSPRAPQRLPPLPRSITTAACACPS